MIEITKDNGAAKFCVACENKDKKENYRITAGWSKWSTQSMYLCENCIKILIYDFENKFKK